MAEQILLIFMPVLMIYGMAGWGLACRPVVGSQPGTTDGALISAFFGLFVLTVGALCLNFWFGLGVNPGRWTLVIGLVLFSAKVTKDKEWRRQAVFLLVVSSAFSAFYRTVRYGFDAGLYHIPYMGWIAQEPLPLGLANFESRLGFNSSWLLFVSAMRIDNLSNWAHIIHAEIAIRALSVGWLAWRFHEELCKGWTKRTILFGVSAAVVSTYLLVLGWSTSTDQAANLCAFLAWVMFSDHLFGGGHNDNEKRQFQAMLLFIFLAVTIKLSTLPVVLLPGLWLATDLPRAREILFRSRGLIALLVIFGVGWLIRSIMLSGCAIFPAASTCVPVSWAVPRIEVDTTAALIMAVARSPGPDYPAAMEFWSIGWLPSWLSAAAITITFISVAASALFAVGMSMLARRAATTDMESIQNYGRWLKSSGIVAAVGILLWFAKGPTPRFSWVFFAIACTSIICASIFSRDVKLPKFNRGNTPNSKRLTASAIPIYIGLVSMAAINWTPARMPTSTVEHMVSANGWNALHSARGGQCWTSFPCSPQTMERTNVERSGGRLYFKVEDSVTPP